MYGAIVVTYLIYFGVFIGLAFIPANLAKNKGYSYGGFYAFGLFFFLPALIVALVIEDKSVPRSPSYGYSYHNAPPQGQGAYGYQQPMYGQNAQPAMRELMRLAARNCYIEAPYRPLKASLLQDATGRVMCSVVIKAYGGAACDSMMARIVLCDVFNNMVASGQQPVRNMHRKGDEITFQMNINMVNQQDIMSAKVFELYIIAVALNNKTTYYNNTPVHMRPLSLEDLAAVKTKYGTDAIAKYEAKENGSWQCVCGNMNESGPLCPVCGRQKEALEALASGAAPTLDAYIHQLYTSISTIDAAKQELLAYQASLPAGRYEAAMQILDEQVLLARRYGASFGEKEKAHLAAVLKGEHI